VLAIFSADFGRILRFLMGFSSVFGKIFGFLGNLDEKLGKIYGNFKFIFIFKFLLAIPITVKIN
jgi:hypothetical protein